VKDKEILSISSQIEAEVKELLIAQNKQSIIDCSKQGISRLDHGNLNELSYKESP
jgi:hypothetical protein